MESSLDFIVTETATFIILCPYYIGTGFCDDTQRQESTKRVRRISELTEAERQIDEKGFTVMDENLMLFLQKYNFSSFHRENGMTKALSRTFYETILYSIVLNSLFVSYRVNLRFNEKEFSWPQPYEQSHFTNDDLIKYQILLKV